MIDSFLEAHFGREKIRFVQIPRGICTIGRPRRPEVYANSRDDPSPGCEFEAEFAHPFWMSETVVTLGLWGRVMGATVGDDERVLRMPKTSLSWHECQAFLSRLNRSSATQSVIARLPTEVEWEYAARAARTDAQVMDDLARQEWFAWNSGGEVHCAGELPPNPFGLRDALGNVMVWCADGSDTYPVGQRVAGRCGAGGSGFRVLRGASALSHPTELLPYWRETVTEDMRAYVVGLRLAADLRSPPG